MRDLRLEELSIVATADTYVDALHDQSASWRDWYKISSLLIGSQRYEAEDIEPDGE